jgi:hypothetical protein
MQQAEVNCGHGFRYIKLLAFICIVNNHVVPSSVCTTKLRIDIKISSTLVVFRFPQTETF